MKLTKEEGLRFSILFCGLLDYVSKVYDIEPWLDFSHGLPEEMEDVATVKDYLWENDTIIDEYILKNPHNLSIEDCNTIKKWKYHNTHEFFYLGEHDNLSVFADDYNFYSVKGHAKEIRDMLKAGNNIVPVMTTLLPFNGAIVYDMVMVSYPVTLGPNMSEKLDDDYEAAIESGEIISTDDGLISAMQIPQDKKTPRSAIYIEEEMDNSDDEENLDDLSDEDMEAMVYAELKKVVDNLDKNIISGKPATVLVDILNKKTKKQLLEICKVLYISKVSTYKKAEIIEVLSVELYVRDFLEDLFLVTDDEKIEFLDRVVEEGIVEVGLEELHNQLLLNHLTKFIIFAFNDNERFYLVVSDEFKTVYNKIMKSDFPKRRRRVVDINMLADAMVKLYGVISLDDFIGEYKELFGDDVSTDEVIGEVERYITSTHGLSIVMDEDLVYHEIANDYDWYEEVKLGNEKKTRKRFADKTIKKYFKDGYFERPKEFQLIEEFVKINSPEFIENEFIFNKFVEELYDYFVMDLEISQVLKLFEKNNLIYDEGKTQALLSLIMNARNNIAIWGNNGWTPTELSGKQSLNFGVSNKPIQKSKKIGRNDPCPCGSGKKYKKCCMLKDN